MERACPFFPSTHRKEKKGEKEGSLGRKKVGRREWMREKQKGTNAIVKNPISPLETIMKKRRNLGDRLLSKKRCILI